VESGVENKEHFIHPELWVCGGLFIEEIKDPITMSQLPLTNYPIRWVHNQEGKLDYYCTQPPSKRANELLPRVVTFLQAFAYPSSRRLRSSGASSGLRHSFRSKLHFPAKYSPTCGGCHNMISGEGLARPSPIWILAWCSPCLNGGKARGSVSHIRSPRPGEDLAALSCRLEASGSPPTRVNVEVPWGTLNIILLAH
jgi:hypothetical protein